jgi:hypothetical protein
MPKYNSLQAFAAQQLANFQNATDANKVLRQAVIVVVPEMKRRIQNDGKNTADVKMRTKSARKYGAYSRAYGRFRNKKGFQTAIIDLTLSGAMMNSLKAGPTGPNSYGIGFLGPDEFKKAEWNEGRFGTIFDPSKYELQVSLDVINRQAQKLLSK